MNKFQLFSLVAPVLLLAMVAHEYAHGYAALRQGDNTAQLAGRLTWNPLKHIDPFFTLILPALMFYASGVAIGGAKPVPVNPSLYRNYVRGDIIVSLAGIAANLALAVLFALLLVPMGLGGRYIPALAESFSLLQLMFFEAVWVNLVLASINLLPIPGLDGSHVFKHILPYSWAVQFQRIGRSTPLMFLLLFLMITKGGAILTVWLAPATAARDFLGRLIGPFLLPNPWTT